MDGEKTAAITQRGYMKIKGDDRLGSRAFMPGKNENLSGNFETNIRICTVIFTPIILIRFNFFRNISLETGDY